MEKEVFRFEIGRAYNVYRLMGSRNKKMPYAAICKAIHHIKPYEKGIKKVIFQIGAKQVEYLVSVGNFLEEKKGTYLCVREEAAVSKVSLFDPYLVNQMDYGQIHAYHAI